MMITSYTPVPYEFREMIEEHFRQKTIGKVFYFDENLRLESSEGTVSDFREIQGQGLFIQMTDGASLRIDRIITLFGKPGAAYDEYAALGNSCMECHGGYDFGGD